MLEKSTNNYLNYTYLMIQMVLKKFKKTFLAKKIEIINIFKVFIGFKFIMFFLFLLLIITDYYFLLPNT